MSMSGSVRVVLMLVAAVVLGSCAGTSEDANPAETSAPPTGEIAAAAGSESSYPDLYRSMGLPVLPGAAVTSTGRQSTSLRDGLTIRLTTTMSVAETRDYYRTAMAEAGWTETAPPGPAASVMDLPVGRVAFTKDDVSFSALLTAADGGTQVAINVLEP